MAWSRMFLIFRLIISAINTAESKSQYETIMEYIKEITATNHLRSLVLVYNNQSVFEEFSVNFYRLDLPLYNIYLPELRKFNGIYHHKYSVEVTYEESKVYFVVINNLSEFDDDLILMRRIYFWRDRDRIVVFVKNGMDHVLLKKKFELCFQHYVVNIVFSFVSENVTSFTYNPFSGEFALRLDNPRVLFPDKFQDLYGHTLKISMFPSVINVFENNAYQGRDGLMSRTIAQHINATYVYILPTITKLAPVLNQYNDLRDKLADVGFNTRFIKPNFNNTLEKTYPHDRDDLTCLVPKKGIKNVIVLNSLLPYLVWFLSFGVSLLFLMYIVVCLLILRQRPDVVELSMMTLLLLINKPVKEMKIFNFRFVLMIYLLFCFFLNTLLICRLTSFFTAPQHSHEIDTVNEFAEASYEILTIDRFELMLNRSLSSDLKEKIFKRLTIIKEEEYLNEIWKLRNVVYIVKDHFANYVANQAKNYPGGMQFYRIMYEKIVPTLSCYIVRYGSPFLMRFDSLIKRIIESGIHDYWKTKAWLKLGIDQHLPSSKFSNNNSNGVSIDQFWFGLQVYFVGLSVSVLVFLLELVFNFVIKLQQNPFLIF